MGKIYESHSGPLVLLILDGWGIAKPSPGNAITQAKTPHMDSLWKKYPHTKLRAAGRFVGLPADQIGNSEAGHMNIGAGRIVEQDAVKIGRAINQGSFFRNPIFINAVKHVKMNNSRLHLVGLLSDGQSAHSDPDHLLALITLARLYNIKNVYLHLFTDGRDSMPRLSLKLIEALERSLHHEKIATLMGRFYSMDRKKNWQRTKQAYNAMVLGRGLKAKSPQEAITQSYNRGETDEFIPPYVMTKNKKIIATIDHNDAVIFFNLRSDRARQITKVFVQKHFEKMNPKSFRRAKTLKNIFFVAMTNFGPDLGPVFTAYPEEPLEETLPMLLGDKKQLYIAEAEKYSHMTYFFNGGYPDPVADEIRVRIPSPDVKYYQETPKMSVGKITSYVLRHLNSYDFIAINFSSPDMMGHTGDTKSAIRACEFVDIFIGKLSQSILKKNGILIITADHGNAEEMIESKTREVYTRHTSNLVPFLVISKKVFRVTKRVGALCDIAPTILKLFGFEIPKIYTGTSLIKIEK